MNRVFVLLMTGAIIPFSFGCGGGGGGGSAGLAYTGVTTEAVVDGENAEDFADASVAGPEIGFGLQSLAGDDGMSSLTLVEVAERLAVNHRTAARVAAAATLPLDPEPGNCGGTARGSIEFVGDEFFDMNLDMTFSDYCEDGTTLNGSISMISRMQGESSLQVTQTFPNLIVDTQDERLALGGRIVAQGSLFGQDRTVTFDFTVEDRTSGQQVQFDDFRVVVDSGFGTDTLGLGGRVYHSEHGYVDLTTDANGALAAPYVIPVGTVAPLVTSEAGERATSGGVLLVGSQGSAAILHVLDETQHEVFVNPTGDQDFDGDGDLYLGPFTSE